MTNENTATSNNDVTIPDTNAKKPYETPALTQHGSVEQLTQFPGPISGNPG